MLLLCLPRASVADGLWTGPVFDAHLHYNEDAAAAYSVGAAFELFSKSGVRAVRANNRPNDGTRALFESKRKDTKVVPFIRVYRKRADFGTWFSNPEIKAMIEAEFKHGYYLGIGEFHLYGKDAQLFGVE